MIRVRVSSTGWTGGPGLNTHYFQGAPEDQAAVNLVVARVRSAWFGVKGIYPSYVTHQVESAVDLVDPVTGTITATLTAVPAPAVVPGGVTAVQTSPATAIVLKLLTGAFHNGRRTRGRAFMSPLAQSMVESNGTPTAEALATVEAFGSALRNEVDGGPTLVVWHRPVLGVGGSSDAVISSSTNDKFAVLRSRRD